MTRAGLDDTIAKNEVERSRKRIDRSRDTIKASRLAVAASREAIGASRLLIRSLPDRARDTVRAPLTIDVLAVMDDDQISQVVEDFTAAYVEASETGDDAAVRVIRNALEIVGRHLATEIGPKAAGVAMN